jgi:glutamine amidotransferase
MKPQVTIIDYGMGNLLSVRRAFEQCGAEVQLSSDPGWIRQADYLVLPGVGAFADGMRGLRDRGLVEAIRDFAGSGRPFLGICLGMQMMLDSSEEFGVHEGLGLIPGKVVAIPPTAVDGTSHRIPHVGWSKLAYPNGVSSWDESILAQSREGTSVYFVHSFAAIPLNLGDRLADTLYNGVSISAAIKSGTLYGCQFHPEKSGLAGLGIITSFLDLYHQEYQEYIKIAVNA